MEHSVQEIDIAYLINALVPVRENNLCEVIDNLLDLLS